MKKTLLAALFAAVAIVGGYKAYSSQANKPMLSDLAKANVEALAFDWKVNLQCPNGCISAVYPRGCYCYEYYPQYDEYDWKD